MTSGTRAISYDLRERLFWAAVTVLVIFASIYIFGISAMTRNVALRQYLEKEESRLIAYQSELEFAYVKELSKIDLALASAHGFSEVGSPIYLSRSGSGSLSFNTLNR